MKEKNDDIFLAKWLSNELQGKELEAFESSSAYEEYKAIIDGIEDMQAPEFDEKKNLEATWAKINAQQEQKQETKVIKLIPNWVYSAAAACVVLFLGYTFMFKTTSYTTTLADQESFELPDGSQVRLNADSNIEFASFNWESNRTLELEGEAYFKVKKGSTFTVKTKEGTVKVLGTEFTVNSRDGFYNVICYEGKVQVASNKYSHILTPGKAFSLQQSKANNYQVETAAPAWISNESSFNQIAIAEVVNELERQYNIQVIGKENLKNQYYTGTFTHTDIKQAVQTIFVAMEIPIIFDENGNVVIKKY